MSGAELTLVLTRRINARILVVGPSDRIDKLSPVCQMDKRSSGHTVARRGETVQLSPSSSLTSTKQHITPCIELYYTMIEHYTRRKTDLKNETVDIHLLNRFACRSHVTHSPLRKGVKFKRLDRKLFLYICKKHIQFNLE